MANNHETRVKKAKDLLKSPRVYPQGCSEFVSEVLGIEYETAKSIMGNFPSYVGNANDYKGLVPGDIAGWNDRSPEHVTVYIGEPGQKFIDVKEPGGTPRAVLNGYGEGKLFKSSKY